MENKDLARLKHMLDSIPNVTQNLVFGRVQSAESPKKKGTVLEIQCPFF
jgi:hypothetical protein